MKTGFKIVAAAGMAMAAFSAAPSQATTYNLGTLSAGNAISQAGSLSGANPSDILTFDIGSTSDVASSITAIPTISIFNKTYGLSSLTATFFSGSVGSGTALSTISSGDSVTMNNLAAGDYYAVISGTAIDPTLGGFYGLALMGNAAAPAPGPGGMAVAMIGGALMLLRLRFRKSAVNGLQTPALA